MVLVVFISRKFKNFSTKKCLKSHDVPRHAMKHRTCIYVSLCMHVPCYNICLKRRSTRIKCTESHISRWRYSIGYRFTPTYVNPWVFGIMLPHLGEKSILCGCMNWIIIMHSLYSCEWYTKVLNTMTRHEHAPTWLILPVVIRSSQRLSHACLSINVILWNCELLITTVIVYLIIPYYLDNRSNSRANTCINAWLLWKGSIY